MEIVGPRATGFRVPAGVSSLLPDFPPEVDIVGRAGYAPMAHGDDLAAAVSALATGKQPS